MRPGIFPPPAVPPVATSYRIEDQMIIFSLTERSTQIVTNHILSMLEPENYFAQGYSFSFSIHMNAALRNNVLTTMVQFGVITMADKGTINYCVCQALAAVPYDELAAQLSVVHF